MTKTYAQLTREIQALQTHAEKLRQSEKKDVIVELNKSIAQYGLSPQDLHFPASSASSSSLTRLPRPSEPSRSDASSDGTKYSDGLGRVWGGRGPRPIWLREAIAQGRSLESFVVTGKTPRRATAAAAPAKTSLPPLYAHPKTGQTWSGRGPRPAWLKKGLKKRGASIDHFLISLQTSVPASVNAAPTSSQAALASREGDGKNTNTAKTGASGQATKKSLVKKVAERIRAAPTAVPTSVTAAPAKRAPGARSTRASMASPSSKARKDQKAQKATSKTEGATPANVLEARGPSDTPTPESPAAPMKKFNSKTNARGAAGAKRRKDTKPPVKQSVPSGEPTPAPSAALAAALPASESYVDKGQMTDSSN